MKKLLIIPILLCSSIVSGQQMTTIEFKKNGNAVTSDVDLSVVKVKLPLTFHFPANFDKDEIHLYKAPGGTQIITSEITKFGTGELTKVDNRFSILIKADRTIIPGEDKIPNDPAFILDVKGKRFTVTIETGQVSRAGSPGILDKPDDVAAPEVYEPGYMFYDAQKLVANGTDSQTKKNILSAYKVSNENIGSNGFLKDVCGNLFELDTNQGGAQAGFGTLLTNLGGTDVTTYAAGMARFLAQRTKEELNEAFFKKMKRELSRYPELSTVFPKTTQLLMNIETYAYSSVVQVLKEAFETDVENLPANIYEVKNLTKAECDSSLLKRSYINKYKRVDECQNRMDSIQAFFNTREGKWVGLGMYTVKEASLSSNPADLLNNIAISQELTDLKTISIPSRLDDYNTAVSIELSNFISQSLVSKEEDRVWVSGKELNMLVKDKGTALKAYLGLLLAKQRSGDVRITFYKGANATITFENVLDSVYDKYARYEPEISDLIKNTHSAFDAANGAVKKMKQAVEDSEPADPQALHEYYHTFVGSLKPIAHSKLLKRVTGRDISASYNKVESYLTPSVDLVYHVATKKYSAALFDAIILLNNSKSPVFEAPVAKSFLKYGTMISTVAGAQTSEEVSKAIEASVLPAGSAAIKRNSNWSIGLNAFVGGYYGEVRTRVWDYTGFDSLSNPNDSMRVNRYYRSYGLYAPIGVTISKGSKHGWGSLSITGQIIDLGALVNFYMTEDNQTALPTDFKVRLVDIFAPGVSAQYGIPRTPLSVSGGMQYVPALNTVDQIKSSSTLLGQEAVRWHVSLVMDIPLMNMKVWDFKK